MTRTQLLQRGGAALCGAVCLAGTAVILSSVESRSMLVLAAVGLSGLTGFAFLLLAFSRQSTWQRLAMKKSQLLEPPSKRFDSMRIGLVLMAIGVASFVAQIIVLFPQNDSFIGEDEEAYLVTAREIALSGGSAGFLKSLYSGEFSEANRHPLFLWLLSGSPQFGSGKFLSALLGLWTMGMVLGLCLQRQLGWLRTGIVCLLLGLNSAWGRFSVTIGCEVLMVGLVACVWFQFFGEAFRGKPATESGDDSSPTDMQKPPVRGDLLTAWVAALLALVWLAKGTGLLLTVGFVGWTILKSLATVPSPLGGEGGRRPDEGERQTTAGAPKPVSTTPSPALRAPSPPRGEGTEQTGLKLLRPLTVFIVVWAAVASPLLVRNLVRYGSPFHNVNSWLLFVDEYSDPVALSQSQTVGQAAAGYLKTHSITDILKRETTGLFWEAFILVRSLGPPPFDDARVIFGGVIALLAALGWLVSSGQARWLLLIWLALCLPMFAWYVPVAAGERFVLPLLVPILCYAAEGAGHFAGKLSEKSRQTGVPIDSV